MKSKKSAQQPAAFSIQNSTASDWKDKQQIMELFPISHRTLQYYRKKNIIPYGKLGGKVFYHLPGLLKVLEASASRPGA